MRKLTIATLVLALSVVTANAAIITDPGAGALQMTLDIAADGSATLTNVTGAPVSVDSYEIWSAGSLLTPGGWYSVQDAAAADFLGTATALGAGALSFGEFTAQAHLLSEGSISGAAVFQAGAPWGIGTITATPTLGDVTLYYTKPGVVGDKFLGNVVVVPEPATMGLLAIGGISLLIRRKR